MLEQAVILAGGLGKRLGNLTANCPKPMIKVKSKPFLEILISYLKAQGIKQIVLSVGHYADIIISHFGDGSRFGVDIVYVREDVPAGTGGFLVLGKQYLENYFLVLNGDTIFDINYSDFYQFLRNKKAIGSLALRRVENANRYGFVHLDNGRILDFKEKQNNEQGLVNGGVYIFEKEIVKYAKKLPFSIETDLFPILINSGQLFAKEYVGVFIDIGIPPSLFKARALIPEWYHRFTSQQHIETKLSKGSRD
jgi:NDP-sugar pyrophosphorylase family protein